MGRDKKKVEQTVQELTQKHPSQHFKGVIRNFSEATEPSFFENLVAEVKELDISMIVNNVGVMSKDSIGILDKEKAKDMVIVNCLVMTMMNQHFLPLLNARKTRSAMLDVSSVNSTLPMCIAEIYAATKTFDRYITLGAASSGKYKNVDFLSFQSGRVSTEMNDNCDESLLTNNVDDAVNGCLRNLGWTVETNGPARAALLGYVFSICREFLPVTLAANLAPLAHDTLDKLFRYKAKSEYIHD